MSQSTAHVTATVSFLTKNEKMNTKNSFCPREGSLSEIYEQLYLTIDPVYQFFISKRDSQFPEQEAIRVASLCYLRSAQCLQVVHAIPVERVVAPSIS